jgi:hypothetical protein
MKQNQNWSTTKPTEPGQYIVKWGKNHLRGRTPQQNKVIVTRRGRGFTVFCPSFGQSVPMSEILDDEFEWLKVK